LGTDVEDIRLQLDGPVAVFDGALVLAKISEGVPA